MDGRRWPIGERALLTPGGAGPRRRHVRHHRLLVGASVIVAVLAIVFSVGLALHQRAPLPVINRPCAGGANGVWEDAQGWCLPPDGP